MLIKHKIRAITSLLSAGLFSILFVCLSQGTAHAATGTYYKWTGADSSTAGLDSCTANCWSVAGNWDISTDGGTTYATASQAPSSSDNGGDGDNLVFDNTSLGSATTLDDDINNLTVDTITSQGTFSGFYYTITGNSMNLVNGELAPTSGNAELNINNELVFTSSQSFNQPYIYPNSIDVPGGVTLTSGAQNIDINALTGGGTIVLESPTSGSYPYVDAIYNTNSSFSGAMIIQSGVSLNIYTVGALGTASITIDSGGQLEINDDPTTPVATDTMTFTNPITLGGNGGGVTNEALGAIRGSLYNSNDGGDAGTLTVDLTGAVTLTSNTELSSYYDSNTIFNLTGDYTSNGHSLTAVPASQPTYGTTTIEQNGGALGGASTTVAAPKTPDTGFGLSKASVLLPLLGSSVLASGIYIISRRIKKFAIVR